jgi:Ca2+-binding RTX toxin-like protein
MAKKKTGTEGIDNYTGSPKNNAYDGLAGDDTILGMGGNDKLWGNDGLDVIDGGEGNDKIWGGAGHDRITGGAGKDTLWGGADTDAFIFMAGGQFGAGLGSGVDIIKDVDTDGDDMDDISVMAIDGSIDSYEDIFSLAKEDGDDVKIDLGNGDVLILADTKKADLSAELFMFEG